MYVQLCCMYSNINNIRNWNIHSHMNLLVQNALKSGKRLRLGHWAEFERFRMGLEALPSERYQVSNPEIDLMLIKLKCSFGGSSLHLDPQIWQLIPGSTHILVQNNTQINFKRQKFWPKWEMIYLNLSKDFLSLEYRFFALSHKISPWIFKLASGPKNGNNNTHTAWHIWNHFFGLRWPRNQNFRLRISTFLRSLHSFHIYKMKESTVKGDGLKPNLVGNHIKHSWLKNNGFLSRES